MAASDAAMQRTRFCSMSIALPARRESGAIGRGKRLKEAKLAVLGANQGGETVFTDIWSTSQRVSRRGQAPQISVFVDGLAALEFELLGRVEHLGESMG
jgi:hypothetical protein